MAEVREVRDEHEGPEAVGDLPTFEAGQAVFAERSSRGSWHQCQATEEAYRRFKEEGPPGQIHHPRGPSGNPKHPQFLKEGVLKITRVGEMIRLDGSDHDWFEGTGPRCTLIAFIDDATSA